MRHLLQTLRRSNGRVYRKRRQIGDIRAERLETRPYRRLLIRGTIRKHLIRGASTDFFID